MASSPPFEAQLKSKVYVCAVALLCAVAAGILYLPSIATSPLPRPSNPAARNSKLETRDSKPIGLDVSKVEPAARARLVEGYGRLPLRFEANTGQTVSHIKFLSRGQGYTMFLTGDEAVLSLRSRDSEVRSQDGNPKLETRKWKLESRNWKFPKEYLVGIGLESGIVGLPSLLPSSEFSIQNPKSEIQNPPAPSVVRFKLSDANPRAKVSALDELPGKSNYFIGNDPKKWRTNVSNYAKVKYQGIYPGIDLVYYGTESGELEYDFVVAPGADPKAIAFEIVGEGSALPRAAGGRPYIEANGDLVISTDSGEVRFHKPVVYQEQLAISSWQSAAKSSQRSPFSPQQAATANPETRILNPGLINLQSSIDNRQFLDGRFVLLAENRVGFRVARYDKSLPLVIDPVLAYSTYLGGSSYDWGAAIAIDSSGNAYVTGYTPSTDFPVMNPLPTPNDALQGSYDVFVSKLSAEGSALLYSTYLGGSDNDSGSGIAVDSFGNAYVTGSTSSTDFPTASPLQAASGGGGGDAFVAKLNDLGNALVYSTYLGGNGSDYGSGIAVDSFGNAYVTGFTFSTSTDFPTVNPLQPVSGGSYDAFVTEVKADGSALVYSTYLGGSGDEFANGIAVDSSGNAYVTGSTSSTNFPTASPLQAASGGGGGDAFVTEVKADGSALVYSTYLGGNSYDEGYGIAVDSNGNAYITGPTSSTDFPTLNAFQSVNHLGGGNPTDAFVTKLNADGSALLYSTFLGGLARDSGNAIAVDSAGFAYVAGAADSGNFPTASPFQAACGGCQAGGPDAFVAKIDATKSGSDSLVYSSFIGGTSYDEAYGIAVDPAGNAYVTGSTNGAFPITPGSFETVSSTEDAFVVKVSPDTAPGFTLAPALLAFGEQSVGSTSISQSVNVGNAGSAAVNFTSITPSGDFAVAAGTTCPVGTPVAAGSACTLNITFTPASLGTLNGSISIVDDAAGSPHTVALSGTGVPPAPFASLSTEFLDFGSQRVGTTSSAQLVVLTNTGDATLNVSGITVGGDFISGDYAQTNNCGTSVAAGANCTISVTFTPTFPGTRDGTLSVTDDAPGSPHTVALSGMGLGPVVSLTPSFLTFGDQNVGTTSGPQMVSLSNSGNATLNIASISVSGDFAQTNNCGTSVAAVTNCTISVTFTPTAPGTRDGTLSVTDDAPSGPHTVTLTGTGADFTLGTQTGGSMSATVSAGGTAAYNLQLEPTGFVGNVSLGCAFQGSTPRGASCSVTPSSVALNGIDPGPFTVNVATTARSLAVPRGPALPPGTAPWGRYAVLLLLGLMMLTLAVAALGARPDPVGERRSLFAGPFLRQGRLRPALQWAPLGMTLLFVLLWAACGSGGSTTTLQTGTPAGNYTLTLTATAGGVSKTTDLSLRVN